MELLSYLIILPSVKILTNTFRGKYPFIISLRYFVCKEGDIPTTVKIPPEETL